MMNNFFLYIILLTLFLTITSSCVTTPEMQTYDNFLIVRTMPKDDFSSLAERYLEDSSRGWIISEFNNMQTLKPADEVIVPLRPYKRGGLSPNGYQTVPVLSYHRISDGKVSKMDLPKERFEQQMRYLKENGYSVITVEQFLNFLDFKEGIPKKSVVITFDDGWKTQYVNAFPVLKKYDFPATIFIYTDLIGTRHALTWEDVKELYNNGIDIQCHSKTHRNLSILKKEESFRDFFDDILKELEAPRKLIKKKIDRQCQHLAYPYGATNDLLIANLQKLGYKSAFTVRRGTNPFFTDKYRIKRSMIYGDYDIKDFKKVLEVFKKEELK